MKRMLVVLALAVACWVGPAAADYVIWNQPYDQTEAEYWRSVHDTGPIVSNDFQAAVPGNIVAVRWWGTHDINDGPTLATYQFELKFHDNSPLNSGQPLPGVDGFATRIVSATRTFAQSFGPTNIWEYYATFAPVGQTPGTIYWLDIAYDKALPSQAGYEWYWQGAEHPYQLATFVQGLVYTPPASPHKGPWYHITDHDDTSMVLYAVPTPAALPLLGSGLLGLLALGWRRRN